jgi:hypothetical protein
MTPKWMRTNQLDLDFFPVIRETDLVAVTGIFCYGWFWSWWSRWFLSRVNRRGRAVNAELTDFEGLFQVQGFVVGWWHDDFDTNRLQI